MGGTVGGDHGGIDGAAARHALVGPPDLWEMKRQFQIDFLRGVGLQPQHRLLDLGCGTLRGGIPLIAHLDPGNYAGVEVRRDVLDEGRRELAEAGLAGKSPQLVHCERLAVLDLGRRICKCVHRSNTIGSPMQHGGMHWCFTVACRVWGGSSEIRRSPGARRM